jgi:hypothetical protein
MENLLYGTPQTIGRVIYKRKNKMINLKKYNKPLLVLILASVLLSSAFVGVAFGFINGRSAFTDRADYITTEGVAGNDYYDSKQYSYNINQWAFEHQIMNPMITEDEENGADIIYPVGNVNPANVWFNASKSLRVGMTEFGEFATIANTGVAYGYNAVEFGRTESWASTGINPALYIQGWTLYLNYSRQTIVRAIEGYAVFSDTFATEAGRKVYSWDGLYNPSSTGPGIVTAGTLTPSGLEILYDSARLIIARTHATIHDGFYNEDVAKVTLTLVFQKDTKTAIVYKDVKILLDPKVLDIIFDFAFSERYEIDLARNVNPSNEAYIHYYPAVNDTVYQHPLTGQSKFDIVQAYNPAHNYIFYAAYWPQTTEQSVYSALVPDLPHGQTRNLPFGFSRLDIPEADDVPAGPGEPSTPWVVAQWRYQQYDPSITANYFPNLLRFLAKDAQREIRFVELFGMTDYNTGSTGYLAFRALDEEDDALGNYAVNNIDAEVQYLVNKVMNPSDDFNTGFYNEPYFMWTSVGLNAQSVDSIGAVQLQSIRTNATVGFADFQQCWSPLGMLDKAELSRGTIPYGLDSEGAFTGYFETFSNSGKGTGVDTTSYVRTGLQGFVFNYYDAATSARVPPQPVAGGQSLTGTGTTPFWYPAKNPLDERWSGSTTYTESHYHYQLGTPILNVNGIQAVGGPKANALARYFNDFNFAIDREGTSNYALVDGGVVTGSAPTSNPTGATLDFYPISSWASSVSNFGYGAGTAVIALARDVNGTRGLSVYGWDGRDTYWACAWASEALNGNATAYEHWFPAGTVAIVLQMRYTNLDREPNPIPAFNVAKALGTITEFGYNSFAQGGVYEFDLDVDWTGAVAGYSAPISYNGGNWFYQKIGWTSTAAVQYDP